MLRIGRGFFSQKYTSGNQIQIGGVKIPFIKSVKFHTDADLVTYSIANAILGALNKGDIKEVFFNKITLEDKKTTNSTLLFSIKEILEEESYKIINIDATILSGCSEFSAYKNIICENIAEKLDISVNDISLKTKLLKFKEKEKTKGIAATASVLLEKIS